MTDLTDEDAVAARRADEANCSATALGLHPPTIFNFSDGGLGVAVVPPWATLRQLEDSLRVVLVDVEPDVVVTWGPDGGYRHADHRLVSAVVTQLVQSGAEGAPDVLLYAAVPSDRMPAGPPLGRFPIIGTDPAYLSVRVPYEVVDLEATQRALACYSSQFPIPALQAVPLQAHEQTWQGQIFLRPWSGGFSGNDVFSLRRSGAGHDR